MVQNGDQGWVVVGLADESIQGGREEDLAGSEVGSHGVGVLLHECVVIRIRLQELQVLRTHHFGHDRDVRPDLDDCLVLEDCPRIQQVFLVSCQVLVV